MGIGIQQGLGYDKGAGDSRGVWVRSLRYREAGYWMGREHLQMMSGWEAEA